MTSRSICDTIYRISRTRYEWESEMAAAIKVLDRRPESLSQVVFESIRDAITEKALSPGDPVSETRLASELGVSKTPVREALLRLRELGLVELDEVRKLRVVRPCRSAIQRAYDTRWAVESAVAELAASRAGADEKQEIIAYAHESVAASDGWDRSLFREQDHRFHMSVARASKSDALIELSFNLLTLTDVLKTRDVPLSGDKTLCAQEHVLIAEAILEGHEEAARRAAGDHVRHVSENVLRAFHVDIGPERGSS